MSRFLARIKYIVFSFDAQLRGLGAELENFQLLPYKVIIDPFLEINKSTFDSLALSKNKVNN